MQGGNHGLKYFIFEERMYLRALMRSALHEQIRYNCRLNWGVCRACDFYNCDDIVIRS